MKLFSLFLDGPGAKEHGPLIRVIVCLVESIARPEENISAPIRLGNMRTRLMPVILTMMTVRKLKDAEAHYNGDRGFSYFPPVPDGEM